MKIKAFNLHKKFGKREVVRGVSLEVEQGEIVGLLGPNGAGKTTTFYMLAGIEKPDKGEIYLGEKDVTLLPIYERSRFGITYLPQEPSVFAKLTVWDNIDMILEMRRDLIPPVERKNRVENVLKEMGIFHLRFQKASVLSGGERRRLEIARALALEPKFLMLDEPFAGVDPLAVADLQNLLKLLKDRGLGILLSDHNVRETLKICDRAYIIHRGEVLEEGTPEKIATSQKARDVYLGKEFMI